MVLGILLCGLLCIVMVEMAANAPLECRRSAVMVAAALVVDWVLFNLAWVPGIAPAQLLFNLGFDVSHEGVWAVTDALVAAFILGVAADYWWAITLWGLLFTQVMLTAFAISGLLPILDILFYIQVLVFFFIGGRGSVQRCTGYLRNLVSGFRRATAFARRA